MTVLVFPDRNRGTAWKNSGMTMLDIAKIVTYKDWWPAAVVLPDKAVWHRVRVYATSAGLLIYRTRPAIGTPEWGTLTPDWVSPIDHHLTAEPAAAKLPGAATDIHTDRGLVVITFTGGCGCGTSLRNWRPDFSTRVVRWPVAA